MTKNVYERLVSSPSDIPGMIAYSVYKGQKARHISTFIENNGRPPTQQELLPQMEVWSSPSQIAFYESAAADITTKFLESVLAEDLSEREKYFSSKVHAEISNIKPNHLLDILKGAFGSLLFVLITGILYFAVWSFSASPKSLIEQIFDVKIISSEIKDAPRLAN